MKIAVTLRWTALFVALGGTLVWLACGANRGWTKTSVPLHKKDPVTEQDYVEWQKKFVPGIEFIVAEMGVALVLFGASFLKAGTTRAARGSISHEK